MSIEFDQGTGLCPHCGHHVAATTIGRTTIDPALGGGINVPLG